jgi:hypothetical protein
MSNFGKKYNPNKNLISKFKREQKKPLINRNFDKQSKQPKKSKKIKSHSHSITVGNIIMCLIILLLII